MVNKAILIGRAGQDAKMNYLSNGNAVASFSLATSRWGKQETTTDWHRVTCFGKSAENAGNLIKKGKQIYVEGAIRYNKYTNRDGVEVTSTEIWCENFKILERKDESAPTSAPAPEFTEEDVPF